MKTVITLRTLLLRSIPILGWLYLAGGAAYVAVTHADGPRILRTLWWIDAFLSVVVHAAQIPVALRQAEGQPRLKTAVLTQIFGITWWKTQSVQKGEVR